MDWNNKQIQNFKNFIFWWKLNKLSRESSVALSMYEHRKWAPKSACCVLIIDDSCSCRTGLLRNICFPLKFIIFSPGLDKESFMDL